MTPRVPWTQMSIYYALSKLKDSTDFDSFLLLPVARMTSFSVIESGLNHLQNTGLMQGSSSFEVSTRQMATQNTFWVQSIVSFGLLGSNRDPSSYFETDEVFAGRE